MNESLTDTALALVVKVRLLGLSLGPEHSADVPLTLYPASGIPGRRTHRHARTLRINHTRCRFSPRMPMTCQHPKNTGSNRQADHRPSPSQPHRTSIACGKNDPIPKTGGLRLLRQFVDFHPLAPDRFTRPALAIRVASCPRTGYYADSQVHGGLRFTISCVGHPPSHFQRSRNPAASPLLLHTTHKESHFASESKTVASVLEAPNVLAATHDDVARSRLSAA